MKYPDLCRKVTYANFTAYIDVYDDGVVYLQKKFFVMN